MRPVPLLAVRGMTAELVETRSTVAEGLTAERVYCDHFDDVTRFAARLSGPRLSAQDLEDVVQEVFVQVHRHLEGFRGEAKLTTWLYRITENAVRQHRRRDRWRRFLSRAPERALANAPSAAPSPDADHLSREAQALIYRAMDGMNARYRTALILFEIDDRPGEEVAELLGLKVANLWVLLHRARADLVKRVSLLRSEER